MPGSFQKQKNLSPKHSNRIKLSRNQEFLPVLKEKRFTSIKYQLNSPSETKKESRPKSLLRKRSSLPENTTNVHEIRVPIDSILAIKLYKDRLTMYELAEISDYPKIYFLGLNSLKINGSSSLRNNGYDDEHGDFIGIIGDHIAFRFEIIQIIGKGSFGQVLKCFDHKTKDPVAIKIIKNKKRFNKQAETEINILEYINKKDPEDKFHLIHKKDHLIFRNHLCIVFDILSLNLYEVLKSYSFEGLPLSIVKNITAQLALALRFLEDHKIIHCDLKPENVLLVKFNRTEVKLIDFGSSCYEHDRVYSYIQSRFYRAPEVILGISYHTTIDIWSLGCIVAELIIGYPLFPGENEHEQLLCIMEMIGTPPAHLLGAASHKDLYFSNGQPIVVPNSRGRLRPPGTRDINDKLQCSDNQALDFISSNLYLECIKWDPADRLTPSQALKHPWLSPI
jgi:dual specificity tyrosine-phosphorylation-regulated kinase 2/3/4